MILPTRPYTPRHKGKIENSVGYVQDNALKGRTFTSLAEQNRFLLHWEATVADTRIHGTIRKQVGKLFVDVERPALLTLPSERLAFFYEAERSVHRDGHVEIARAYYSVPPEYLGRKVWVRWDGRLVRVFNHRFEQIAMHPQVDPGRFSTLDPHIAPEKISGVERGTTWQLQRVSLIGPEADRWAQQMLVERGIQGLRVLQGLLSLPKQHPAEVIERACQVASSRGLYRLRAVREAIAEDVGEQEQFEFIEQHPIIRDLTEYGHLVRAAILQEPLPAQGSKLVNESLLTTLRKLRLSGLAQSLEVRLQEATGHNLSHAEFLELIFQDELAVRSERSINRRIKAAGFRELRTLDNFDFAFNPSIKKKQIFDLATGQFIRQAKDVLLLGPPGVGKSFLAEALGYQAIKMGFVVYYRSIFDLVRDFLADEAFAGADKLLARYLKPDLLIVDDMGIKQLPKRSGEYLFEIIMRRYETKSTMMTSNRPLEDWGKLIGDVPSATAILDRFLHHAEVISITGKSYRMKDRQARPAEPADAPDEPGEPSARLKAKPKPQEKEAVEVEKT